MASVNRVTLIGNLTRDPALKFLPNQTPVVEFGMAMNRKFRGGNGEDREEVCFIDCAAFGKQAEVINQYCQKGKQLYIEGRLKFDTWEDKQGGGKRSKHTVVVDNFVFLGGGRDGGAPGGAGGNTGGGEYSQTEGSGNSGGGGGGGGGNYGGNRGGYRNDQRPAQRPPASRPPAPQSPPPEPAFDEDKQFGDDDIPF